MSAVDTSRKPRVLVPVCNRQLGDHPFHIVGKKYIDAVRLAGCLPVIVPNLGGATEVLDDWLALADGVFLTGSPSNVHPSHFEEDVYNPALPLDPGRDALTLPLIRRAVDMGLPLFAICRGFQETNVALGGSLHQAVQEQPGLADHRAPEGQPPQVAYGEQHAITVLPGGRLEALLGPGAVQVNSLHGQGVNQLAPGLRIEAVAPDGLVEAFSISPARGFSLCVQWHPEWQAAGNPTSMALLQAFGRACRDYRDQVRQPRHDFKTDPET
ncbi:gamma-glutamyl-gamma-aminobutyrate hydrolase family protein [Roseateles saccharophilus]|uniref:gamma-glutamyl-gamma-aminobutyrate hydrolase n=1 Tax=Roseateles saccharophilus TaxID=304 RepID=A0A4R3VGI0_ROSSA|nr:gamma-glutamyl-gamma-aminobutyrate hydrolase family protein [Roseateles saccharophilus]MDG0832904.1 gamma-glutamyl-gamma-aminobutyrate hydrolase family protein [Roseateles saccharophilus]TCV04576.1 gamma-glutamyl-gamma-aminobutyrate hydrolase [Roseateles saccharophilus]